MDLKGGTIIPGLNDSHCHISMPGGLRRVMGVIDASYEQGVRSLADILDKIAEQVKRKPKGEWINVSMADDTKLVEKRHANRYDLDTVAPDHPVMLFPVGGHLYIANSKAFEMVDVTKDTPDPDGGKFERDPATGELTGWIHEYRLHGANLFNK